ncbi:primase-helicase family protein [Donghicola eburneus]|uniref:NrS-1 polymerase-like helicase domain-containing protein n=1 Tax=Donghicola eburneus TaxID=393278 RepID=A0A1M4N5U6_9RHOB|nr:primase-helicase family protein [Donghicola eburneus]SCM69428.1 hypothetical protein KARMA_3667 [Donghicola eburneus]
MTMQNKKEDFEAIENKHILGEEETLRKQEAEIYRVASQWYVQKENRFYDTDDLSRRFTLFDIASVITTRLTEEFSHVRWSKNSLKKVGDMLTGANRYRKNQSFPIWNGTQVCKPGTTDRLIWEKGMVTCNTWVAPDYRAEADVTADGSVFEAYLAWIIPNDKERQMLTDWLAWSLQHEGEKPRWAIFLYSAKHGTGKSTLAGICKALFGAGNTAELQGVQPLVQRFNKPALTKKFIYAEEVKVGQGSEAANKLKTIITEDEMLVEAKGKDAEPLVHKTCCMFTSNHKPVWLEQGDRRFYVIDIDHDGCNGAARYEEFRALVGKVKATYADPQKLAGLYRWLMERKLSADFDASSLDVGRHATEIMRDIQDYSADVDAEQLREFVEYYGLNFIPAKMVDRVMEKICSRRGNAAKHLFSEIGWKVGRAAWRGEKTATYYAPKGVKVERGVIIGGDGAKMKVLSYFEKVLEPALDADWARSDESIGVRGAQQPIETRLVLNEGDDELTGLGF